MPGIDVDDPRELAGEREPIVAVAEDRVAVDAPRIEVEDAAVSECVAGQAGHRNSTVAPGRRRRRCVETSTRS